MNEYFPDFTMKSSCMPGMDWLRGFKQRNKLKSILETSLEDKRIQHASTSNIGGWFDDIYTEELSKKFHHSMVANLDETMLTTNHRLTCVVRRCSRFAITPETTDQEHITMLVTVAVTGEQMPPLCIFQLKNLPSTVDELVKKTGNCL